jgi:hypothetical protein
MRNLAGAWWRYYRRQRLAGGLLCLPLLGLVGTGGAMLAAPHLDTLMDRPYTHLAMSGPPASAAAQASAAVAAVPGSVLLAYELPPAPNAAVRIFVGRGTVETRVYVHPQTLHILKTVRIENRPLATGPLCGEPDYAPLDRLVKAVAPLGHGAPVLVVAPARPDGAWTVKTGVQGARLSFATPRSI